MIKNPHKFVRNKNERRINSCEVCQRVESYPIHHGIPEPYAHLRSMGIPVPIAVIRSVTRLRDSSEIKLMLENPNRRDNSQVI